MLWDRGGRDAQALNGKSPHAGACGWRGGTIVQSQTHVAARDRIHN